MSNYLDEFPAFDDVLPTLDGFHDSSWHNDACPSLTKDLGNENFLQIFIDWKNKEMSDFSDLMGDDYTRYAVMLSFKDGNSETVLTSNNWEVVEFFANNFKLMEG